MFEIRKIVALRYHLLTLLLVAILVLPQSKPPIEVQPEMKPKVVDQITETFHRFPASEFHQSNFKISYIGSFKEELYLNDSTLNWKDHEPPKRFSFRSPGPEDISFLVDTTSIIGTPYPIASLPTARIYYKKRSIEGFLSHPVVIKNLSNDTLSIGFGHDLPVIVEALNECLEWLPIQDLPRYYCATGLPWSFLCKNEMLIASYPILQGNFSTTLRLRFGYEENFIYSNEFTGRIDKQMFEKVKYPERIHF